VYEARRTSGETPVPSAVVRRTIAAIGRTLVTLGLLILLFVTYELWGTGIFTARAQSDLKHRFQDKLDQIHDNPTLSVPSTSTTTTTPGRPTASTSPPTTLNPAALVAPPEGEPIGKIVIPKIDVDWVFVEGVQLTDLDDGPGHYPGTPLPGQIGNAAIAGHRTTHGAPFYNINELAKGDRIEITTLAGKFVYAVTKDPFPVQPKDSYVIANTPDAELTLTSCHPRYSADERLIVKAKLLPRLSAKPVVPPKEVNGKPVKPPPKAQLATALEGQANSVRPSFLWGLIVAIVGAGWWFAFRRWRHPLTWLLGLVPFIPVLFVFYVYLERALPNGY
jgi:sortase A